MIFSKQQKVWIQFYYRKHYLYVFTLKFWKPHYLRPHYLRPKFVTLSLTIYILTILPCPLEIYIIGNRAGLYVKKMTRLPNLAESYFFVSIFLSQHMTSSFLGSLKFFFFKYLDYFASNQKISLGGAKKNKNRWYENFKFRRY